MEFPTDNMLINTTDYQNKREARTLEIVFSIATLNAFLKLDNYLQYLNH